MMLVKKNDVLLNAFEFSLQLHFDLVKTALTQAGYCRGCVVGSGKFGHSAHLLHSLGKFKTPLVVETGRSNSFDIGRVYVDVEVLKITTRVRLSFPG